MVDVHHVVSLLRPQHDNAAHDQGDCHGDRVEQVVMNLVGEQDTQNHGRKKTDQQVQSESLCIALGRQSLTISVILRRNSQTTARIAPS